jgi:oligoribonuclease
MKKMFWIDMEMTGLDVRSDKILEIAVIITDYNYNVLDTYHQVVYQPQEILENMNEWCKENHGKSGLTAAVANGTPLSIVEQDMVHLVEKHYGKNEKVVVCGNSVGMDKLFIDEHMNLFSSLCHYRVLDVTSFKEFFRSKYGVNVQKVKGHRALDDIRESIEELKYYNTFVNEKQAMEAGNKDRQKNLPPG